MRDLPPDFAARLISWSRLHGRTDLPWQGTRDPYRVWLSEVMLQQTQVATVIDYFHRFLRRFPDVQSLAAASEDDVLSLWSGLGYYSRARHLHRCAREVVLNHDGRFPSSAAQLATLPGIGRSTAAAIAAFCFGERAAILDGNVKRVLARMLALEDDASSSTGQKKLWEVAGRALPHEQLETTMPAYTQAIMDLGASVCLPRKPRCDACPVSDACAARQGGDPERFPARKARAVRRKETIWLLIAHADGGAVWLDQRGSSGVWARLFCPPQHDSRDALLAAVNRLRDVHSMVEAPPFTHVLTHKELDIHVVWTALREKHAVTDSGAWYSASQVEQLGLPTPIRKVLIAGPGLRQPHGPEFSLDPARGGA